MALSKEAQAILIEATRLIHVPGAWFQRSLYNKSEDRYCALGAIDKAAGLLKHPRPSFTGRWSGPAEEARKALMKTVGRSVLHWNDDPTRTVVEVQKAFCETVKREVIDDGIS